MPAPGANGQPLADARTSMLVAQGGLSVPKMVVMQGKMRVLVEMLDDRLLGSPLSDVVVDEAEIRRKVAALLEP